MRVCVTGGSGFVGSQVVAACLDAGHEVVATVRTVRDARKTAPLDALASRGSLAIVAADLLLPGSFDEALRGCQALLHVASVASPTTSDPQEVIRPALDGLRNVLAAAARAGTVRRVVLTSSVVAMGTYRQASVRPLNESDWNDEACPERTPYDFAKTQQERLAIEQTQTYGSWELVCLHPTLVLGPVLCRAHTQASPRLIADLLRRTYPASPRWYFGLVDVRDVAAAHVAALQPAARGRYLLCGGGRWLTEIAAQLKAELPSRRIATATLPTPLLYAAALVHPRLSLRGVRDSVGLRPQYDSTRAQRELGLQFRPLDQTVRDTAQSLLPYL